MMAATPRLRGSMRILQFGCCVALLIVRASAGDSLSSAACANCMLIARAVEIEGAKLETGQDVEDEEQDYLLGGGNNGQRRKMMHDRSEIRIRDSINNVCHELSAAGAAILPDIMIACNNLITKHVEPMVDWVYENGPVNLVNVLCAELEEICPRGDQETYNNIGRSKSLFSNDDSPEDNSNSIHEEL
ncbi:hypothetical protein CYMTET_14811 [Cymbomonas tetramitiformis]|uniref:Saposin B-type domain-containing protein n=1 Tax=Cymbomonas tetramitiformis TaxID=36881 RepID=A0AAE0GFA5_9CHLO|nr:hypothetical protein CYMTET_14811 [Cymbomonas tetramitiformis]